MESKRFKMILWIIRHPTLVGLVNIILMLLALALAWAAFIGVLLLIAQFVLWAWTL